MTRSSVQAPPQRWRLRDTPHGLAPEDGAGAHPDAALALEALREPEVRVDLDLAEVRRGRTWRLHSWQAPASGRVATLATVDGAAYELGWLPVGLWQLELARTVTSDAWAPVPSLLPDRLHLPLELMLATGEAHRRQRPDLLAELARREVDRVRCDGGSPVDTAGVLTALHAETGARLQVLVSAAGRPRQPNQAEPTTDRPRRLAQVSWLRSADGWRALTAYSRGAEPWVALTRVGDLDLGIQVAQQVTVVHDR